MSVNASTVCELAEISYRQLNHWIETGVLVADDRPFQRARQGYPRTFEDQEVRVARALGKLRSLDAPLDVLAVTATVLRRLDDSSWHGLVFVEPDGTIASHPTGEVAWALDLDAACA